MNRNVKKLSLNKESLVELTGAEIGGVVGGNNKLTSHEVTGQCGRPRKPLDTNKVQANLRDLQGKLGRGLPRL